MKAKLEIALLVALAALAVRPAAQEFEPTWESLSRRGVPDWFAEAKLGIFVHWGVYSVPAWAGPEQYAEWMLHGLLTGDEGRLAFKGRVYGDDFPYQGFGPLFRAELFDPEEWAELFRASGARYVVLTAKHHDGYCLWPSAQSPGWNSVEVGPRRDLVGDLDAAVRRAGLRMGLYYSFGEWRHPLYHWMLREDGDDVDRYVAEHMVPQLKDLVRRYQPSVLFADGDWEQSAATWRSAELLAWLFNGGGPPELAVNDRWGGGAHDVGFLSTEYSAAMKRRDRPWVECRGLGRSFGYNRNETLDAYLSSRELVQLLARAASRGGGLLLNVGPRADGQIPLLQQERLRDLGRWLQTNGEAIYGTHAYERTYEPVELVLRRVDPEIDFDWVRNGPGRPIAEDAFTAVWTGFLEAPETGSYTFFLEADDGARLSIAGKAVVDAWDAGEGSGEVELRASERVPLRLEYHEEDLNAQLRLLWSHGGREQQVIPSSAFSTSSGAASGSGLEATYRSEGARVYYTAKGSAIYAISLVWPRRELELRLPRPVAGTEIRLLGAERSLPWSWADGTLFVDVTGVAFDKVASGEAWVFRIAPGG